MIKKIVNVGGEKLAGYELDVVKSLKADFFVSKYESGSYDGSGMAIWKRGRKWFYDNLGHCSCYGPTENLETANKAGYTFEQIKELVKTNYTEYQELIDYIVKHK